MAGPKSTVRARPQRPELTGARLVQPDGNVQSALMSEPCPNSRVRSLMKADWDSVAMSCILLPTIRLLLRRRGLQATASWLAIRSDVAAQPPDTDRCNRMAKSVSLVSNRPLIGASCLPRSLTIWFLLRRQGVDADIVIGAGPSQNDELPAHAWVEVDGVPLNEPVDNRDRLGSFGLEFPRLTQSQL